MARLVFGSLRARLILLVFLAFIPALALILYTDWNHRRYTLRDAENDCLTLARAAAREQNTIIEEGRALVFTLAQIPQVQKRDAAACNDIFANLLKKSNRYISFNAVNLDGVPFATAPPSTEPVTFADRRYFARLLETRDFVVSEYILGKRTKKPVIVMAGPVFDEAGNLVAIIANALDLKWLNELIAASGVPEGATLTVADRDGTVLARYPDPEGMVGRTMPEADIIKVMMSREEGVAAAPGLDGVEKIFGFTTMGTPGARIRVAVSIPKAQVFAKPQRELMVNLITLILVTALVLNIAWFGGDALVLRPAQTLLGVTRRLQEGDLTARTRPPYVGGELGELAQAFDEMAESLQRREAERLTAEEELRQSEEKYRGVVDNIGVGVSLISPNLEVLAINRETQGWFPHLDPTTRPLCYRVFNDPPGEGPCSYCPTIQTLKDGLVHTAITETPRGDEIRNYKIISSPLKDEAGEVVAAIEMVEDITEQRKAEGTLRRQAELLKLSYDAILVWQRDGDIESWFFGAERLYGFTESEALGRISHKLLGTVFPEPWPEIEAELRQSGTWEGELRQRTKEGREVVVSARLQLILDADGTERVLETNRDITKHKQAEEELHRIEWLLTKRLETERSKDHTYLPPFGSLKEISTSHLLTDTVGEELLTGTASNIIDLIGTSMAIYEKNGDYALGIFSSGWCRFLDQASYKLCGTDDLREALASGRWLCHESCWTDAAKVSIETGRPVDIECHGGIRLFAVPVWAGDEIVGSVNFGYGNPPKDLRKLQEIAAKYHVSVDELQTQAEAYESRPPYIIDLTKERLLISARLMGEIVERQRSHAKLQTTTRALRVLSLCNQALIRAANEGDLLHDVCRIIVETGEYLMAFVGYALDDEARTVRPEVWAGMEAGFLETAKITWADDQWGQGPSGTAIRTGKTCLIKDVAADPATTPWRDKALCRGFTAVVGLPLQVAGQTIGGLTIAAAEGQAFDPDEVKLLEDLAADLSYGIETLRTRAERLQAREDKAKLEDQLLQAQKMEAVGRLAGGVAHDFNNMLTVIRWYSDIIIKKTKKGNPIHSHAEGILQAATRAIALTDQLLTFSRKRVIELQVLDLNVLIKDMEQMLRSLIGEDIAIASILDPELGAIKADPAQMGQVIMNLAINAQDAMPRGGNLTVETGNVYLDAAYAHDHLEVAPGNYVMLAVSDNGMGMDAETLSRIFEPFFTTKKEEKGTGLGLATVYGIVKQSGGHIWVYSEPGQGTTFKVYFPRVEGKVKPLRERKAPTKVLQGLETILVVEDEYMLRDLICETLGMHGYTVLEARDGSEALRAVEQHEKPLDLLLSDVVLPKVGGPELAERLSRSHPEMRVIFMSGYTENAIVHHGVLDPGINFIHKPFTSLELMRKVREVLDS